jgi:hypothetical protein
LFFLLRTPAEVPVNYPIAQHIEMSFFPAPPRQLFFSCLQPSSSSGGETALADFRKVYQDCSPELRQKLLTKGIRYQRTNKRIGARFTYDVSDMLGWSEMFGTNDKAEVERMCAAENTPVEWVNGDTFVSTTYAPAFQLHPITKEPVWFNHTQVFHWTTFPAELFFAWQRTHEWRLLLHCFFVSLFCIIKYGILGHQMSLHCSFGDGESISIAEMTEIRRCIHQNMVFSRWQKSDLLMIDNFSVSHGRQPTYDKGRKIGVSWGEPLVKTNELTADYVQSQVNTDVKRVSSDVLEDSTSHEENPQDKSPEATLTSPELHHLQQAIFLTRLQDTLGSLENTDSEEWSDDHVHKLKALVHEVERKTHKKSQSLPVFEMFAAPVPQCE